MAKVTLHTFLSLDGVMQAPGGPDEDRSGGFDQGGWLVPFADDDMGQFMVDCFTRATAFLLGRRTYEIFAAHWPHVTDENDPIASGLNSLPKHVASTTLSQDKIAQWHNSTLIPGDVPETVGKLKSQYEGELQIHGSGTLAQSLMAQDLIDEYRLLTYPVVLGTGQRLFAEGAVPTAMKLTESRTTSTGVAIHVYQPTGRPTYGSFALDQPDQRDQPG